MKAAVLHEFSSDLVVEDVEVSDPAPDEVLVRTVASGVCHTDRTMQLGANPLPLPLLLGHEVSGVVEAVGRDVTSVRPGDPVATCASSFCGTCRWCQQGQLHHCENKGRARADGTPRLRLGTDSVEPFVGLGGFAEQLLVHERTLVKLPDEMPLDKAALLGCAGITGLGAVRHAAGVRAGETVAVIGCGGVGLNAVQGARLVGASRIIAVDRIPAKLEMARLLGATDVVDASSVDPVAAVLELTGGIGVDHALEVVGLQATLEQAFAMLDTRGTATMVGVPRPEVRVSIPAAQLLLEKRLQGTKMGSTRFRIDIPLYCRLYLDGRLQLDELLSATVPLTSVNAALADLDNPSGARTVLTF